MADGWYKEKDVRRLFHEALRDLSHDINQLPVDYREPVLRCKECGHRTTTGLCRVWDTKMAENEYCSRAEPKRDEWDKQAELGILPPGGTISAQYPDREGSDG